MPDQDLWAMRQSSRHALVEYSRRRYARHLAESGAPQEEIAQAADILDPEVLTLGFARRFATYKRPTLLLHDPERLVRLLTNPGVRCRFWWRARLIPWITRDRR